MPRSSLRATDLTTVFGRTLAALRVSLGHSQREFAAAIPMDRSALARVEIGRTTATLPLLYAVERALLDHHALRLHGDLLALAEQVAGRLRAEGVLVYRDRPPEGVSVLPDAALEAVATEVVAAWVEDLRAEGLPFGAPVQEHQIAQGALEEARWMVEDDVVEDEVGRPTSGRYLRAARARGAEAKTRPARPRRGSGSG